MTRATTKKPAAKKAAKKKSGPTKADLAKKAHEVAVAAANKKLLPLAKDINVRLSKADAKLADANDMRLSAALQLAEAEKIAVEAKIPFKTWCTENIEGKSYETARRLLIIGRLGDTEEARMQLQDMRSGEAARKRVSRQKKKADKQAAEEQAEANEKNPVDAVVRSLSALDDGDQRAVIDTTARKQGMVLVTKDDAKDLSKVKDVKANSGTLEAAKNAFDDLSAKDKMTLLRYASEVTGTPLSNPAEAVAESTAAPSRSRRRAAEAA
jgi:hypothetical protein|tara:strand:- start:4084 stop:4887 length:804 start_codon:yes stop_codon:yes gene_type:complete